VIDEFENTHIDLDDEEETKKMIGEEAKEIHEPNNYMAKHKFL
jgi:hypothetical protein